MQQSEFENIVKELRATIMSVTSRYKIDSDDAGDIAQDTLIKLWQIRHEIDSAARAKAFVARVARNAAIDLLRHNSHNVEIDLAIDAYDSPPPNSAIEHRETEQWLERMIAQLPKTEYHILRLRQLGQMDNHEIAAILGITPDSVRTLLRRSRQKLLEKFKNEQ